MKLSTPMLKTCSFPKQTPHIEVLNKGEYNYTPHEIPQFGTNVFLNWNTAS